MGAQHRADDVDEPREFSFALRESLSNLPLSLPLGR